jgi:hypothetical protein
MKKGMLFILLLSAVTVNSQSLKDALYGGKLKTDSGTVIKKGDDLSTKIDTSRKKPVEPGKNKPATIALDSSMRNITSPADATATNPAGKMESNNTVKDNNKIWKEFVDAVVSTLNTEVMTSKKIKKGDYYVTVDYEIGLDGQVIVNNVYPSPESKFLEEQVKERLGIDTPKLNPVLSSNGKPRKVIKRYNFTLTKS